MNQLQTQTRKQWGARYQHLLCQWISVTKLTRLPEGTGHSFISWINLIHPKLWASFKQLWEVVFPILHSSAHWETPEFSAIAARPRASCQQWQRTSAVPGLQLLAGALTELLSGLEASRSAPEAADTTSWWRSIRNQRLTKTGTSCSSPEPQNLWTGADQYRTAAERKGKATHRKGEPEWHRYIALHLCYYFLVAMGIQEKAVSILYSKAHVKSRCEKYHLFAAYNFLFQVVLNSFVWGKGINDILFSIHVLKLANLPALENIQEKLKQWQVLTYQG